MNPEVILEGIKKLSVQKGDILVLDERAARWFATLSLEQMDNFVDSVGKDVPVIVGKAERLTRDDLIRLLENLPQ